MNDQSTNFKKDDIIFLLGAGASVEAGIPHSATMVQDIQKAVMGEWKEFEELYNYVRSSVFFADGQRGKFDGEVSYNIERLVEAMEELCRRMEHPLYPFIGSWNPRLLQVAGSSFERVDRFRAQIVNRLRHEWIEIKNYESAGYYEGLLKFQQALNHPLRVFTLNYDLCLERVSQAFSSQLPERGFDEQRFWKWQLFEDTEDKKRNLFLYKLHGSIDWMYDNVNGRLTFSDSTSKIKPEESALIFGTSYKLQYVDPFLFLVYEFRRWSLDAKLVVVVGYGFADEHINGILKQAIRHRSDNRLLSVAPIRSDNDEKKTQDQIGWIASKLGLTDAEHDRIHVLDSGAKDFFENTLNLEELSKLFPKQESPFQELS